MKKIVNVSFFLPFLTIPLLYFSFPVTFKLLSSETLRQPILVWVSLIPLIIFVIKEKKGWKAVIIAYIVGYIYFALSFSWLWNVAPIGVFLIAIYEACHFGLFASAIRFFVKRGCFPISISVAVPWTALEFIRCYLFSGLPWFYLGHTQYSFLTLVQIADVTGVYGISCLIALVNGFLASVILQRKKICTIKMWQEGFCILAMFGIFLLYGVIRLNSMEGGSDEFIKIGVVGGNVPQDIKELQKEKTTSENEAIRREIYDRHFNMTQELARGKPDLVIWSESSFPYWLAYNRNLGFIKNIYYELATYPSQMLKVRLLTGTELGEVPEGEADWLNFRKWKWYNSAVYIDPVDGIIGRYDKVHLVPFSEYIPLRNTLPFLVNLVSQYIGIAADVDFNVGKGWNLFEIKGKKFGVIICFEGIFPDIARTIKSKGADFLVNISNDGWFKDSAELDQILAIVQFRAIETRIPVVRATNTGISAFISHTGRIEKVLSDEKGKVKNIGGILEGKVFCQKRASLYVSIGDVFSYINFVILVGMVLISIMFCKKEKFHL